MNSPDVVFDQLAKLYDFYKEIARFWFRGKRPPEEIAPTDRESESLLPRR